MSTVTPMFKAAEERANGAGMAVAIAAARYKLPAETAALHAQIAREMVMRGFSASHAVAAVNRRSRRNAPPPSAA